MRGQDISLFDPPGTLCAPGVRMIEAVSRQDRVRLTVRGPRRGMHADQWMGPVMARRIASDLLAAADEAEEHGAWLHDTPAFDVPELWHDGPVQAGDRDEH